MGELHTAVALEYLDDSVASAQVTALAIFKAVTMRPHHGPLVPLPTKRPVYWWERHSWTLRKLLQRKRHAWRSYGKVQTQWCMKAAHTCRMQPLRRHVDAWHLFIDRSTAPVALMPFACVAWRTRTLSNSTEIGVRVSTGPWISMSPRCLKYQRAVER
jgi:hypothetical protein